MKTTRKRLFFIFSMCLLISSTAHANIGLPMIVIAWPIFWFALIPIILIEWMIVNKDLTDKIGKIESLTTVTIANLVSTTIGIPLAWLIALYLQLIIPGGDGSYPGLTFFWKMLLGVTIQAAWLLPYENELYWMIPVTFIVLLIPFFLVSYWIESRLSYKILKRKVDGLSVYKTIWKANIMSYAFLLCLSIVYLIINL